MNISIDFGASKTRVGYSSDLKSFQKVERFETQKDINLQIKNISEAISTVSGGGNVKKICLGIAGIIDIKSNTLLKSPNYDQLNGKKLDQIIPKESIKAKLIIENDAALGGIGEAFFGAGRNFNTVAYLTLSSGVGGVRVEKNKNSFSYFAAEPGHQIILEDGKLDKTTNLFGTLQSYCSGRGFTEMFGESAWDSEDNEAWEIYSKHLATGIINIISMWVPDVIILGGGITHKFDSFYKNLILELNKQSFYKIPPILKSELGDDSGIFGGLVIIKEKL